jgi:predicted O-methyltransferase YrrM
MNAEGIPRLPKPLAAIERDTRALGFDMAADRQTGALLRVMAASKPGGRLLELGTGTGLSTCWLLDGMDPSSSLDTVDTDHEVLQVARRHLGSDPRLTIHQVDGVLFLRQVRHRRFELIFADAWPGKFHHLDEALALLGPGGLYVVDDLLSRPTWPEGHASQVASLVDALEKRDDLYVVQFDWSTGIIVASKKGGS